MMSQLSSHFGHKHTNSPLNTIGEPENEPPILNTEVRLRTKSANGSSPLKKKRLYKQRYIRIKARRSFYTLFDSEIGEEIYGNLLKTPTGELYHYWHSLSPENKIFLVKYLVKINCIYSDSIGAQEFEQITYKISIEQHFPPVLAKAFFEILFDNDCITGSNIKLKEKGWESLSTDEKIAILYDLSCLYPDMVKRPENLYDIAIENPKYIEPVVAREINRLAIKEGEYDQVYVKFIRSGWPQLSVDEKVVLTNGLCEQHRGVTADLDQVLYNVRVYNDIPAVIIAEKYNRDIDTFLSNGRVSHLIGTIQEYHRCSGGELIRIQGVCKGRIQETINRIKSTSS